MAKKLCYVELMDTGDETPLVCPKCKRAEPLSMYDVAMCKDGTVICYHCRDTVSIKKLKPVVPGLFDETKRVEGVTADE